MKRLIIDLDGTITEDSDLPYAEKKVKKGIVERLILYKEKGYTITIFTARNMRTFGGDLKKIKQYTYPEILTWLFENDIPHDEVIVGKPWCGDEGFYIDDRAIRPSEFIKLTDVEIKKMLEIENSAKGSGQ